MMKANGQAVRQLTHTQTSKHTPVWSPDGQKIAFSGQECRTGQLWLIDPHGSNLVCLTG